MALEEWLASEDPVAVLLLLLDGNRGTNRVFLLFALGYCRVEQPPDERSREAMELVERVAEGLATAEEVALVLGGTSLSPAYEFLEELLVRMVRREPNVDEQRLTALFYCVFGDPRRPPPTIPASVLAWNDGCVVKLAATIYEQKTFDRLPVLADALEEAGCCEQELLGHLRGPGPHARGCHVLDLLLGKE